MADVCASCHNPLVVTIDPDSDEDMDAGSSVNAETIVPDDVYFKLQCSHHFHWDCLLEAYEATSCPACGVDLVLVKEGIQRVLCDLNNEGGLQEDKDILPLLTEESYLKAYPEERRARAFMEFCREGDIEGVISVLQDDQDDEEDIANQELPPIDVLRYQDPLAEQESALQAAVSSGSQEIAWLILFLASDLPLHDFPQYLMDQAQSMGFTRRDMDVKVDVRGLKDANGRTAAQSAPQDGSWSEWISKSRLSLAS